jgi:Tfp pilus assembly protein PilE
LKKKLFANISSTLILFLLGASLLTLNCSDSDSGSEKDLILILDTSLSMAGHGGKNILPQVKKSLPVYIEQLEEGDSITLITFDTEVTVYPTVYIDNEKNKKSFIEYIKNIRATGKWTYTKQMIEVALRIAQELEQKDEKRQQVLVVMTDALDDPPPAKSGHKLNIRDIAKNYKDKDWFIFFINFSDTPENRKLAAIQQDIETSVTSYTNVITPGKDSKTGKETTDQSIAKTIEKDLSANIQEMTEKRIEKDKGFPFIPLIIAIIIIAIVLAVIFYLRYQAQVKVSGKLEYWDHTLLNPYFENYNMTKQNVKEIIIGKTGSSNLTIRDIEITTPFKITATRVSGEIKNTLQSGKGYNIEYVNREPGGYLKNGDMFKVANYTFKYTTA